MVAVASPAQAQENKSAFAGLMTVDKAAIRYQQKAEQLYELGNYKRSYFIYRNELAPIGDKYAQYMVGFMHLMGQGTDVDRIAATAWYRLAAERGTREFVMVHNQLLVSLTPEQIPEYERQFIELRKRYGDLPILMQAVREDVERLKNRTGSRIGSGSSPVMIIDVRQGRTLGAADTYYEEVEDRLQARLEMIARYTETEIAEIDVNTLDLDELEEQVNRALESTN